MTTTDWVGLWKRWIGDRALRKREVDHLNDKLDFEPAQAAWSLVIYRGETLYPDARDFVEWLGDSEPPSELVSKAYLSDVPLVMEMAGELETLQAAWFPTEKTRQEIDTLETRLVRAL